MDFLLKGVTTKRAIEETKDLEISQYSFDLRPKSFNFTQAYNIKNILNSLSGKGLFSLIFKNEKNYIVKEILKSISEDLSTQKEVLLEFSGVTPLEELEEFKTPYIWHYHRDEKIKDIRKTKYLKRIVFHHLQLEEFNLSGELHGFFNLFSAYTERIDFEVQLEWDSEIMLSFFDFYKIAMISFEVSSCVEKSYQSLDPVIIRKHLVHVKKLFQQRMEKE